jgi:3-hydroxyisobutyrate dehydrogenase
MAEQAFKKAGEKGLDDLDMSAVILPLEEQARVVVKRNK